MPLPVAQCNLLSVKFKYSSNRGKMINSCMVSIPFVFVYKTPLRSRSMSLCLVHHKDNTAEINTTKQESSFAHCVCSCSCATVRLDLTILTKYLSKPAAWICGQPFGKPWVDGTGTRTRQCQTQTPSADWWAWKVSLAFSMRISRPMTLEPKAPYCNSECEDGDEALNRTTPHWSQSHSTLQCWYHVPLFCRLISKKLAKSVWFVHETHRYKPSQLYK